MPGLITELLGEGLMAARPATPDIATGAIGLYYATDDNELSVYADGAWIEDVLGSGGTVSDTAYGSGWNGDTTTAPSKNAVYDKIESLAGTSSALYEDQKAANTSGGTATSGSWLTRPLNTEVYDDIGLTLSSNQISLAAGTYAVEALSTFYKTGASRIRLQDVTNTATLALGSNGWTATADGVETFSIIDGRFTLAGTATVELQYRVQATHATFGLGVESNFGVVEIYSRLKLTKLS